MYKYQPIYDLNFDTILGSSRRKKFLLLVQSWVAETQNIGKITNYLITNYLLAKLLLEDLKAIKIREFEMANFTENPNASKGKILKFSGPA